METVIKIKNLYFKYEKRYVLEDVNIEIKRGEYVAFIGPNGGGKSTLAKLIVGLLKPSRGSVLVFGEPPERAREKISYVPQNINFNLDLPLTVMDVALQGRLNKNKLFFNSEDKEIALKQLNRVGMESFKDRKIGDLSGGQRQRVLIARALASEPEILILDEPTASVDPKGQKEIYKILNDLNITRIVISHDVNIFFEKIDRAVYVNRKIYVHENIEPIIEKDQDHFCEVELLEYLKMFKNKREKNV
ncbi:MAG: metal ABC transporter ATP-binding protein [Epsilonproteobacteria bacterium]|nr:metal ABC transporter ATP-binding protein [Campylobacterota bacterium]